MRRPLQRLGCCAGNCLRNPRLSSSIQYPRSWPSLKSSLDQLPVTRNLQFTRGYAKIVPAPSTRGISQTEYELRRKLLMDSLPEGSVCVVVGASMKFSSDSVLYGHSQRLLNISYHFQQDPNFSYLTGFIERNALAVLSTVLSSLTANMSAKDSSSKGYNYHLFVLPVDPEKEKWDGLPIGIEGAMTSYHADSATSNLRIAQDLPSFLTSAKHVYLSFPTISGSISGEIRPRQQFQAMVSRYLPFLSFDARYQPLVLRLHEMRSIKSSAEVQCMREAGRISGRVFNEVIRRKLKSESEIEATLEWLFRMGGCQRSAYVPVVAGGKNALTIHYTRNTEELHDGDMVLVDAGGVWYCFLDANL